MAQSTPLTPGQIAALHERASEAAQNSYSPYSHFRVGAAVLLYGENGGEGAVAAGTNVENASYRLTSCAEQAAIAAAVAAYGPGIRIRAVAVVNLNGAACTPCGACRQTMLEFADADAAVFYPDGAGGVVATTIGELLPAGFRLKPE
ncbi:MAG: cytidine deaminase [Acidobacteriaceae bacterium]|jgi:cytidine deaminase